MQEASTLTLNIIELFESVQGESSLTGLPTTFIRLAACNLRCTWCDTPYSFVRGTPTSMDTVLAQVDHYGHRYVCVTGGEPLLQDNVHPLMKVLCDKGFNVSIETGGSLDISKIDHRVIVILDIKCPGSGMEKKNLLTNLHHLKATDEIKFVLKNEEDYTFALNFCRKHSLFEKGSLILLSPVFGDLDPQKLVTWILRDRLPVRLNLQIHKFIWSPSTRGV